MHEKLKECLITGKARATTSKLVSCDSKSHCDHKMPFGHGHFCRKSPLYDKEEKVICMWNESSTDKNNKKGQPDSCRKKVCRGIFDTMKELVEMCDSAMPRIVNRPTIYPPTMRIPKDGDPI